MFPLIAQTTSSVYVTDTTPMVVDSEPYSAAGAAVFFFIVAVIIGGALLLYLRHRPRPTKEDP